MDDRANVADMLAVHAALTAELEGLVDLVDGVPSGDAERAGVVAEHYRLVTDLLELHHGGEDDFLWPVLLERDPGSEGLIDRMRSQHVGLDAILATTRPAFQRWADTGDPAAAALLSAGLAELSAAADAHFALEEAEVLPVAAATMTQPEWDRIGEHARSTLAAGDPMVTFRVFGMIADHNPPGVGEAMLAAMPPPVVEAWRTDGEPGYRAYRARLAGPGAS